MVGLLFPSPGDAPNPQIEPISTMSPALAGGFFTTEPPGKPLRNVYVLFINKRTKKESKINTNLHYRLENFKVSVLFPLLLPV